MKIRKGLSLVEVGNEHIIISTGREYVDFHRVINLNESAASLWKAVERRTFDNDDLVKLLVEWYDITPETAQKDVNQIVKAWTAAKLIE